MNLKDSALPISVALVGVLLGFFLATTNNQCVHPARADGSAGLTPHQEAQDLTPLLEEMRALGDRIVSLQSTPSRPASPVTSSERVPVGDGTVPAGGEPTEAVVQLLERCTALLEKLDRRVGSGSRRELSEAPATASREPLSQYRRGNDEKEAKFTKDHLMLSYQQIIDRYGKPDHYYPGDNGTRAWQYGTRKGARWTFTFTDGLVSACHM